MKVRAAGSLFHHVNPRIQLKLSALVASMFTYWAIAADLIGVFQKLLCFLFQLWYIFIHNAKDMKVNPSRREEW